MKRPRSRLVAATVLASALGLLFAPPALAQQARPAIETDDPIVVTGIREKEREIDEFVGDLSVVSAHSPMARYEPGEYCPRVLGLPEKLNTEIASRMRQVAAAAGVRPAEPNCATSALVMFAEDQAALQAAFRKEHPEYFRELSGEGIDFQGEGSPVLSWKLIGRLDKNGQPVPIAENGIQIVNLAVGSSRLQSVTRPVIAMAVLLIQRDAVAGLTTRQIADYALMRTLTETDPAGLDGNAPTILRLIDLPEGSETPLSLTEWDLAYLKGRYASDEWNLGYTQLAKIRGTMRRALLGLDDGEGRAD